MECRFGLLVKVRRISAELHSANRRCLPCSPGGLAALLTNINVYLAASVVPCSFVPVSSPLSFQNCLGTHILASEGVAATQPVLRPCQRCCPPQSRVPLP
jgi:hypothetical protein